ncbi:MAG: acetyl-CoA carboxylase biotin carboxylase subunit [Candidatus Gastranaerophilales bacterium]|nr:acetyl-CoA carboxylase biotin carboxylase subunit [Candidatus Gastranaerophilales bacterium]
MFKKVLVANRGEVAVRVIRACREIGIPTVAVYSEADADSLHVSLATEAYCIGPAESAKSYLNIPSIISTALISGADAIHPGYGFMSERADFADICEQHGIKFIGPTGDAIRKMGDKAQARATMQDKDIPITPGMGIVDDINKAKKFCKKVGYPVIVKATAGGGGKGMRIVNQESELEENIILCKTEAQKFFGNPAVYIEKYLVNPRHIEVQILADKFGNVVYLGERDCSIQRRHQKLVEEAPSPAVSEKVREKLGRTAVKAAKAVKYEGVGTVEFLLDKNNNFYFMEMNTRLQVEHGITEMISNVDIVREQINIAAGKSISVSQRDIELRGHAIECRINAEDPDRNFLPAAGQINGYVAPGGFGVRVDSHVYSGYTIPPYYDSLISKVMCWAPTREQARRRMYRALKEYVITGVKTTLPFYQDLIEDPVFSQGKFDTGFLEDYNNRKAQNKPE